MDALKRFAQKLLGDVSSGVSDNLILPLNQKFNKNYHLANPQQFDDGNQNSLNIPPGYDTSKGLPLIPTRESMQQMVEKQMKDLGIDPSQIASQTPPPTTPLTSPQTPALTRLSQDTPPVTTQDNPLGNWHSAYQSIWDKALQTNGITDPSIIKLLVTSENGKENPHHINYNNDGTIDVGLTQVNVDPKNTTELQRLQDPEYAINKGTSLYAQRLQNLGDPVLALSSYNKGARGAVLDPIGALQRAKALYQNAQLQLPQTPFVQDPQGFVKKNNQKYKSLGILPE